MPDELNPTRLALARRRRGLTKAKLAERLHITSRSVANYENGDQQPSPAVLDQLAEVLSFPVEFFTGTDVEPIPEDAASFRSLTSMSAAQRNQALGAGSLAVLLDEWIDLRFARPEPDLPDLTDVTPDGAAEIVRAEWGLGHRPVSNMVHLLERQGVRVFSLDEEGREVDAFSFWRHGHPYVLLNTLKSAEHGRFDAAHELGHLVLHRHGHRGRDAELQAQQFAAAFLLPRSSVLAAGITQPSLAELVVRKTEWKVSVTALIMRLHDLELLSDWQYRTLFVEASKRGYRRREPNPVPRERSQVLAKVIDQLRAEGVSRHRIAQELCISTEDFDRLVFGLVLLPRTGGALQPVPSPPRRDHLHLVGEAPSVRGRRTRIT